MALENLISWFEIPVSNFERGKKFYETIFDIKMSVTESGEYRMGFFPYAVNKVNGAICYGDGYIPSGVGSIIYLSAEPDMLDVLNKVPLAGGEILLTKTMISETSGYYAFILDSEGNRIGLQSMQ